MRVVAGGDSQVREVSGGTGYLSQGSLTAEFGLGRSAVADSVIILWPSGVVQESLAVAANQRIVLVEPVTVAIADRPGTVPLAYHLYANVPNPFNPVTTIQYDLPEASPVGRISYP